MSWTQATTENRFYIRRAETILAHHKKTRPRLFARAVCTCCHERWGTWGCDDTVWATDHLNRMSDLLVSHKPAPLHPHCGRRAHRFRHKINRAAIRAETALRRRFHSPQPATWRHVPYTVERYEPAI